MSATVGGRHAHCRSGEGTENACLDLREVETRGGLVTIYFLYAGGSD